MPQLAQRIRNAWEGRISGCQLGKPVELLSMRKGHTGLTDYLRSVDSLPLRDYIGYREGAGVQRECCRGHITRSEADDDINYSALALLLLERHGTSVTTADVARAWLTLLPAGATFTAERVAYRVLLDRADERFAHGAAPGFDLAACSDNVYNDWIGAQIRADVYGWVNPGRPALAAELARRDAALSHRGDGVYGAMFVAALGAALADNSPADALELALAEIPPDSGAADAVRLGASRAHDVDGGAKIRTRYEGLSVVHTLNNLALVVWALYSHLDDFGAAIGDVVAAGLDTDCNGATVGGLWGIQGGAIPQQWTAPWQGRVALGLAGHGELSIDELVERTTRVAETIGSDELNAMHTKRIFSFWVAGIAVLLSMQCVAAACNPVPGLTTFYTDGWGIGLENHRLQHNTTISRDNVAQLELAWSYGYFTSKPRSWPLVTEDTIFIGDSGRGVVALDRATGCERWVHADRGEISSAILHTRIGEQTALVFLDRLQGVFAIDATDGSLIWNARVEDQPIPMYSGTPVIHDGVVYAPLSSLEIGLSINPIYGCCTTSGGMAAFDLQTGKKLWFRPTIEEAAHQTGRHWLFVEEHGPSGAPVWGAPMLDPRRGVVYFGTGQNYSRPATTTSDAIFALKSETGEKVWVHQFTEGDAYNIACDLPVHHPNCHLPKGPDVDFGAPPMLVRVADGRELLIAGQKSADIYALNPDTGEIVWHNHLGRGGALGGIHWGLAANEDSGTVFVPISDIEANNDLTLEPQLGLYALDAATGTIKWRHARTSRCAERECFGGLSAAITATPDFVVAGSLDGFLEIYDATNGNVLWSDDSWKAFTTVNGVEAKGGAYDAHGPMIAGDQVIVSSGYGDFFQRAGNVLLVYQIKQQPSEQGGAP